MPSTATSGVEAATKKSYKGGWLDKDLRRANGRLGFAAGSKPKPQPLNEIWGGVPAANEQDGWVTASDGSKFEVCPCCGSWSGVAQLAHKIGDRIVLSPREYAKRGCDCDAEECTA